MQKILRLQRLSGQLYRSGLGPVSRVLDGIGRLLFAASVPGAARIAPSVFFHHSGLGVVINKASVIEDHCEIGVNVVLGGKAPLAGAPHLEEGVIVHAGAVLVGPIRIGKGSVVAANSVVVGDVPAHSLVAGMPAVVKRSGLDTAAYRTTSNPQAPA